MRDSHSSPDGAGTPARSALTRMAVPLSLLLAFVGAVPAAAEAIKVEDSRGQLIEIEGPVRNVAIFPLPIPEAMIAIDGGTERLAAINPRAKSALLNGVIGQLFPEIAKISTELVAGNFVPNVEEILKVGPDVVMQWNENLGQLVAPMENAGIKVVTVSSANRDTRRAYIAMLGKILGKEARAQGFLDWDDEVYAELGQTLDKVPDADRPRIIEISALNGNEVSVFGWQQVKYDAGGLKNAATEAGHTDGTVKVGAETLLYWNPKIIFINYYNDGISRDDIFNHPVLASLDAVKQGRVYKTPKIDPATAAGGQLTYRWFAEIGHPDLFATDVRAAISAGFERLYGKPLNGTQLDTILQMGWNHQSAGYAAAFAAAP